LGVCHGTERDGRVDAGGDAARERGQEVEERLGWQQVGSVELRLSDGRVATSYCFVAPTT
jgi:hypothetical protein